MSTQQRSMMLREIQRDATRIAQNELEKQAAVQRAEKKGEAVGIKKGEAVGMKKAKATIVERMHRDGISMTQIASMTDYTIEAVENIIKGHSKQPTCQP